MKKKWLSLLLVSMVVGFMAMAAPAKVKTAPGIGLIIPETAIEAVAPFITDAPRTVGNASALSESDGTIWLATIGSNGGRGEKAEVVYKTERLKLYNPPPKGYANQLLAKVELTIPYEYKLLINNPNPTLGNSSIALKLEIVKVNGTTHTSELLEEVAIEGQDYCAPTSDRSNRIFSPIAGDHVVYAVRSFNYYLPEGDYYAKVTISANTFGQKTGAVLYKAKVDKIRLWRSEEVR